MKKKSSATADDRGRSRQSRPRKTVKREVRRTARFNFKVGSQRRDPGFSETEEMNRVVSSKRSKRSVVKRVSQRTYIIRADIEGACVQLVRKRLHLDEYINFEDVLAKVKETGIW